MKVGAVVFIIGVVLIFGSIVGFYYTLGQAGSKTYTYSLSSGESENHTIPLKKNVEYHFSLSADYSDVDFILYSPGGEREIMGNMNKNSSFEYTPPESGDYVLSVHNHADKGNRVAVVVMEKGEYGKISSMIFNLEILLVVGLVAAAGGIAIGMIQRK